MDGIPEVKFVQANRSAAWRQTGIANLIVKPTGNILHDIVSVQHCDCFSFGRRTTPLLAYSYNLTTKDIQVASVGRCNLHLNSGTELYSAVNYRLYLFAFLNNCAGLEDHWHFDTLGLKLRGQE